ncbi:hypothetical protein BACPU_26700 [Bacillus pumilus]|nr:hypothetical protein BACPU_26700 [Bacillus pumilus]
MPVPTKDQLETINKFSQVPLEEDQVFVFRSLSADTLPVKQFGWFGEYSILMTENMLLDLKQSYKTGVGLLASHNSRRLPFGRTYNAEVTTDSVDGESVKTLYVDHYIVKYTKDSEGNKVPLRTEVNNMTTQDIANHIEVGHAFDTSIGFEITNPGCSICGHDIRDYSKCDHLLGQQYDVMVDGINEKKRCDLVADAGEAYENSLVYAGAVNRAIVVKNDRDSNQMTALHDPVNAGDTEIYNVEDVKSLPLNSKVFCSLSKGGMNLFSFTQPENKPKLLSQGGMEMPTNETQAEETKAPAAQESTVTSQDDIVLSKQLHEQLHSDLKKSQEAEKNLTAELEKAKTLLAATEAIVQQFSSKLKEETLAAGIKARGNSFSKERFEKYLNTLSLDELAAEKEALEAEFSAPLEAAQLTQKTISEEKPEVANLSAEEKRALASKEAALRFKREGGDIGKLTKEELDKLNK